MLPFYWEVGTLNETLCELKTKQATRPGDKMEAAHFTCRHQDTQRNGSLVTMHKFIFKYRRCLASFHFNITQSARRPNKIILPKAKTTSKSLFLFQTSLLWNCLPPRLTAEPSIIVFKNELRKLICKHSASLSGMPTPCTYPPPPCAPLRIHAAQLFTTFTLAHTCTCTSFKAVNPLIGDKPLGTGSS